MLVYTTSAYAYQDAESVREPPQCWVKSTVQRKELVAKKDRNTVKRLMRQTAWSTY